MIVMADADIPRAVEGALRGRFYNAGQMCTAVKRLYLHEKISRGVHAPAHDPGGKH